MPKTNEVKENKEVKAVATKEATKTETTPITKVVKQQTKTPRGSKVVSVNGLSISNGYDAETEESIPFEDLYSVEGGALMYDDVRAYSVKVQLLTEINGTIENVSTRLLVSNLKFQGFKVSSIETLEETLINTIRNSQIIISNPLFVEEGEELPIWLQPTDGNEVYTLSGRSRYYSRSCTLLDPVE